MVHLSYSAFNMDHLSGGFSALNVTFFSISSISSKYFKRLLNKDAITASCDLILIELAAILTLLNFSFLTHASLLDDEVALFLFVEQSGVLNDDPTSMPIGSILPSEQNDDSCGEL